MVGLLGGPILDPTGREELDKYKKEEEKNMTKVIMKRRKII